MNKTQAVSAHNKYAPYWAVAMILFVVSGLSVSWLKPGGFWSGYVIDMVGPAWSYILIRGLFTAKADNRWTRFFTPTRTFILLLATAFGIETMQYFKLYDSTFDWWDLLAYLSILVPVFGIDKQLARH